MVKQRGFTLGGVIILMGVLVYCSYTAFRIFPAYMDYWLVQNVLKAVAGNPDNLKVNDGELKRRVAKEFEVNNIRVVTSADVEVERIPEGLRLSTDFSMKQHYFGPISLCMDFHAVGETR